MKRILKRIKKKERNKKVILKTWNTDKYTFKFRNVLGHTIDVYRNDSQFVLIQLDQIFSRRFLVWTYRKNISFRRKNKDLPKWMFPKWQLAENWKEELQKHIEKKKGKINGFIGDLDFGS